MFSGLTCARIDLVAMNGGCCKLGLKSLTFAVVRRRLAKIYPEKLFKKHKLFKEIFSLETLIL